MLSEAEFHLLLFASNLVDNDAAHLALKEIAERESRCPAYLDGHFQCELRAWHPIDQALDRNTQHFNAEWAHMQLFSGREYDVCTRPPYTGALVSEFIGRYLWDRSGFRNFAGAVNNPTLLARHMTLTRGSFAYGWPPIRYSMDFFVFPVAM